MFHMKRKAKSKKKDDSMRTVFFILIYEAEEDRASCGRQVSILPG